MWSCRLFCLWQRVSETMSHYETDVAYIPYKYTTTYTTIHRYLIHVEFVGMQAVCACYGDWNWVPWSYHTLYSLGILIHDRLVTWVVAAAAAVAVVVVSTDRFTLVLFLHIVALLWNNAFLRLWKSIFALINTTDNSFTDMHVVLGHFLPLIELYVVLCVMPWFPSTYRTQWGVFYLQLCDKFNVSVTFH